MMRRPWGMRLLAAGVMVWGDAAFTGRPLTVDDADPVDRGQFEFEAGASYERDADNWEGGATFALTYGFLPRLELGIGGGIVSVRSEEENAAGTLQTRKESGFGDLTVGLKWQVVEACPLGARHALALSVKAPTADEDQGLGSGKTDADVMWIASRPLSDKAGVHLNVGHSWIGGPDANVLHYGVALDLQLTETVQWVGEVFAERETFRGADTVAQFSAGFRWNPSEGLTLDIAAGSKIHGDGPDITVTAGLTWAFGVGGNRP